MRTKAKAVRDPWDQQKRSNQAAQQAWEAYASHRSILTSLATAGRSGGTACIIGAGNLNDIDLNQLLSHHAEIHLIDIDLQAMKGGVFRQGMQGNAQILLHDSLDVFGLVGNETELSRMTLEDFERTILVSSSQLLSKLPRFEFVLSDCLVSQYLCTLSNTFPAGVVAPWLRERLFRSHLDLVVGLTAAGGNFVFASDLVSSDSYPVEQMLSQSTPEDVLREITRTGNHFVGASPHPLAAWVRRQPRCSSIAVQGPWAWPALMDRTYAVYAICGNVNQGDQGNSNVDQTSPARAPVQ